MKKSVLAAAVVAALGVTASYTAEAATLSNGDVLTITAGAGSLSSYGKLTGTTGSFFAMGSLAPGNRTLLSQGVQGLLIGTTQNAGGYTAGTGPIPAGDVSNITAPWSFYSNTGKNLTVGTAVTGGTSTGLNMSGWTVDWNNNTISMGSGAWQQSTGAFAGTYTNGVANFTWDGTMGDSYTLNYTATVPSGSFKGVEYLLHLQGTVTPGPVATAAPDLGPAPSAVPIPAAAWLFGSGLVGLVGIARRKKSV